MECDFLPEFDIKKIPIFDTKKIPFGVNVFIVRVVVGGGCEKKYLGEYMSDSHQILYTSRGLPNDLDCKFSDDLRIISSFYVFFFYFKQENLVA